MAAIQLVEPIHERLSGRLRLRARLVLARCYLENPNWVKRAEEMLQAEVLGLVRGRLQARRRVLQQGQGRVHSAGLEPGRRRVGVEGHRK